MELFSSSSVGQFLAIAIAVVGAAGVIVQMILHVIQMKRERLEIQKLERHSAEHTLTEE